MKTIEEQIRYLAENTPHYASNFAHGADTARLLETIWIAYKEEIPAETLKENIQSAFDERNEEETFRNLEDLKIEIDNSVDYIYPFLEYAKRHNLLKE